MKSFLEEISEILYSRYGTKLGEVTVVFPNKRAGLFFIRALSNLVNKPVWSPHIYSIEEFIFQVTGRQPADRISLTLDLFNTYRKITGFDESFDRFYFWGDMLLNDFDEIDSYLADPGKIFSIVKDLKEIEAAFPFLTDEQKDIIKEFWGSLADARSDFSEGFLRFWRSIPVIYQTFRKNIAVKGQAYRGMIYRQLAERIRDGEMEWNGGHVVFAGFNALTVSEEVIIKWFLENNKGDIFWDTDEAFVNNRWHEAGHFHRKFLKDTVFGKTFPSKLPDNFKNSGAEFEILSTSSNASQSRWAGNLAGELLKNGLLDKPEKTVIVLPDETQVTAVLSALPEEISKVNVTIAYPVRTTPLFSFFELLIELHENRRISSKGIWFSHRQVLPLLAHPVTKKSAGSKAMEIAASIREKNIVYIHQDFLTAEGILGELFKTVDENSEVINYLSDLLFEINAEEDGSAYDAEIRFYFYRLFRRVGQLFSEEEIPVTFSLLKRLFRQIAKIERVSFTGEPLEGLQVMGILETRNLDFENIIILNANDSVFPGMAYHNSFIPYNVRKVFGLPNFEHTGSIYSYLFYRLIPRAKKVWLAYNSEESGLKTGEPSRFIQQLKFETGFRIEEKVLSQPIHVKRATPLIIDKDEKVMELLSHFKNGIGNDAKHLTPSALNTFLDCPLSFYFKYVLGIKEQEEVTPDFNAVLFGNILHKVMEELYRPFISENTGQITGEELRKITGNTESAVEQIFASHFGTRKKEEFIFEGRNILGREIIISLVHKILEADAGYAPFRILGIEKRVSFSLPFREGNKSASVNIKGIVDRIDEKDGRLRIIDYKSGRDSRFFDSVEALFSKDERKRNKAVFQTLFYSMVLSELDNNRPYIPGLFNVREIYNESFSPELLTGRKSDARKVDEKLLTEIILPEFRDRLDALITEIFDPSIPFRHAEEEEECKYCHRSGFPV